MFPPVTHAFDINSSVQLWYLPERCGALMQMHNGDPEKNQTRIPPNEDELLEVNITARHQVRLTCFLDAR